MVVGGEKRREKKRRKIYQIKADRMGTERKNNTSKEITMGWIAFPNIIIVIRERGEEKKITKTRSNISQLLFPDLHITQIFLKKR